MNDKGVFHMRYVVTGGAGFIGSHLAEALADEGHSVVIVDDFSTGSKENLRWAEGMFFAGLMILVSPFFPDLAVV